VIRRTRNTVMKRVFRSLRADTVGHISVDSPRPETLHPTLGYVHTDTSESLSTRIYGFQETQVCMYFNGGRSH